jgi:hypothetical protein
VPNDVYRSWLNNSNQIDLNFFQLRDQAGNALPAVAPPNLRDFSNGRSPLDAPHTWDLAFSVDPFSRGLANSEVRRRSDDGHAVGADVYYTNPSMFVVPTNGGLFRNHVVGLSDANPLENIDGIQLWNPPGETDYPGFFATADKIYYALSNTPDLLFGDRVNNNWGVFRLGATMGLGGNDRVDALITDKDWNPDGIVEAIFSLTPDSPSLWGLDLQPGIAGFDDDFNGFVDDLSEVGLGDDFSAADLFYTSFNGWSRIAVTGDVKFGAIPMNGFPALDQNLPFIAGNLGLLATDNIDAIELAQTGTFLNIPMIVPAPGVWVVVPEPSSIALGLVALAMFVPRALARRAKS